MVQNINKLVNWFLRLDRMTAIAVICFLFPSCRATKQVQYSRDETTLYRDTTINIPMEMIRFDVDDIGKDTTIIIDDARLQIIHDTINAARIYYMKSPQVIKLDSVIQTNTIKEVTRIRIETQSCNSKFHKFTTSFFQWVISLAVLYAGIKSLTK